MGHVLSYDQFLNEAVHIVKRKYTDAHPEKLVSDYAPVREKVLSYLNDKGSVTEKELQEFLKLLNEETGRKTNMGWVKANERFFSIKSNEGVTKYSLSKEGKRIHEKMTSIK